MIHNLTCIECPIGCALEVSVENGKVVSVTGNACPRGKAYAENEVVCPRRVVTSTVRTENGKMLPVKTAAPVKKSEIFRVMETINRTRVSLPIKIGDVLVKNVSEDIDLIATDNMTE